MLFNPQVLCWQQKAAPRQPVFLLLTRGARVQIRYIFAAHDQRKSPLVHQIEHLAPILAGQFIALTQHLEHPNHGRTTQIFAKLAIFNSLL